MIDESTVRRAVRTALEEDLGAGDITSEAVLDAGVAAVGTIVTREPIVACGLEVARETFRQVDARLTWACTWRDGAACPAGTAIAVVRGAARSILAAERTALNFLQRMSGIATATHDLLRRVEGTGMQIADMRKTAPGLRAFDKHAVASGGGTNHRVGLHDAFLIKDNHWRLAGGVAASVRRARAAARERPPARPGVEVEVTTLDEVREAIDAGADAVLLDNMDEPTLRAAMDLARGRVFVEVSGGVGAGRLASLAALGVGRVSIGALTHSPRAVDIALEVEAG